jgi:hypothetical protein
LSGKNETSRLGGSFFAAAAGKTRASSVADDILFTFGTILFPGLRKRLHSMLLSGLMGLTAVVASAKMSRPVLGGMFLQVDPSSLPVAIWEETLEERPSPVLVSVCVWQSFKLLSVILLLLSGYIPVALKLLIRFEFLL